MAADKRPLSELAAPSAYVVLSATLSSICAFSDIAMPARISAGGRFVPLLELCRQMNERSMHCWFRKGNSAEFYTRHRKDGNVPHSTNNEKPRPSKQIRARIMRAYEISCCRNILRSRKFRAATEP